ncbi:MAG: GAF domain-containing protein [Nitrospinae bacterium]|nr:GAF domain-containing protein [Nitrospinota bacterium]MBF0634138.1 GAF domain-containing protein [Nitrospinota bacterium]
MNDTEDIRAKIEELTHERDAYARTLADSNAAFREKVSEFSIIKRIGDSIRWNLDKRRICEEIVDIIIDETAAENCSLWLMSQDRSGIQLIAVRGQRDVGSRYFPPGDPKASRMALGEGVAGWVAQSGTSMLIENVRQSGLFVEMGRSDASSIKSLLCLPIKGQKEVSGVVNMSHPDIGAFSKDNERVLNLITNQAGLAFENLTLIERIQGFNEELERTVAERTKSLSYSESKYRSFMESAGDAILVVDRATRRIQEANGRAVEYTGTPREELVGKDLGFLFDAGALARYEKIVAAGSGRLSRERLREEAGAELYFEITISMIASPSGEVAHLIIRDITSRLIMEAQLKEYNESLEDMVTRRTMELEKAHDDLLQAGKMAAIGELASGVAHEINNPIAIISGYAEDLMDNIKAGSLERTGRDQVIATLSMITSQAERCMDITNSLLNFARRQEIFVSPVSVNQVALAAQNMALHKAGEKKIRMENRLDPSLPNINSDLNIIDQILLNIYNNAMDAIEGGGVITTATALEEGHVSVAIADTGTGIPQEVMPKIFDPFFTTKPVGKGTGLGLSLCRQLLERLKGKIRVGSEMGRGTVFTVTLPINIHPNENIPE